MTHLVGPQHVTLSITEGKDGWTILCRVDGRELLLLENVMSVGFAAPVTHKHMAITMLTHNEELIEVKTFT